MMSDAAAPVLDWPAEKPIATNPPGVFAVELLDLVRTARQRGLLYIAGDEAHGEHIARTVEGLAPDLEVLVFPPWDCLPYDRVSPSRDIMGRRTRILHRLSEAPHESRLIVTTVGALLQRVLPQEALRAACCRLAVGAPLELEAFESLLGRTGYLLDERVDEAGEAAIRGAVIDLFPAGAEHPCRLDHADGRITGIRRYDPVSQRTVTDIDELVLAPASEVVLPVQEPSGAEQEPGHVLEAERWPGIEHWLPSFYDRLETLFDYLPTAPLVLDPEVHDRCAVALEQIADAYETRTASSMSCAVAPRPALKPSLLYLDQEEWSQQLRERTIIEMLRPDDDETIAERAVPRFATKRHPVRAFVSFVRDRLAAGERVVLATGAERELRSLIRQTDRHLGLTADRAADWNYAVTKAGGTLLALRLPIEVGFVHDGTVVIAAADLLGARAAGSGVRTNAAVLPLGDVEFRLGDAVIHMEHGMAALRGVDTVTTGEVVSETIRLEYGGGAMLMVPIDEIDQIWRYGADAEAVSLDRLDGESWPKRRAEVEAELAETARHLVEMAREREETSAPALVPPRREYERLVARFRFSATPDQARAIDDSLRDLASTRPMDRLICGDVGFGKTEVALRAAAAAALCGKQVAVVTPTTVLARQHEQTFVRRFAGLGIRVAQLSRLLKPADARAVKKELAEGSIHIIIGTHALAGKGVRFKDLGLLIIDEEQRFGARHKDKLRALGGGIHTLTMTATPIPRTLQAAMVGLQDVSVIATPPVRRQPVRTFLSPFDAVTVREACLREQRRGGQSFLVCPRIEDIDPMADRLAELVPELDVRVVHGKMPAAEIDDTMVHFAAGEGDILLATNIIESGLDVPCANTILIWRPDRFGLAQLHQLRGRVGRGRMRGVCYLLTNPETKLSPATEKRLRTLEALDRLGAGFAISARDLDQRGAGDLVGEEQAGHVKLIGVELYQHLLKGALSVARGEPVVENWSPNLNVGVHGFLPAAYVPEAEVRINLYARATKLRDPDEIEALGDEIEDRFGPLPEEVQSFLALARLRSLCRQIGVARIEAGPRAIALTFRGAARKNPTIAEAIEAGGGALGWHEERLILRCSSDDAEERLGIVFALCERLAATEE